MVNTFLPYPDVVKCAKVLDYRRLGKQRLEAWKIIAILEQFPVYDPPITGRIPWRHHPATRMWEGCVDALKLYYNAIVTEWVHRGYNNTMPLFEAKTTVTYPWWFGWEPFHQSHRASLLRKDQKYYCAHFTTIPLYYLVRGYLWPSKVPDEYHSQQTQIPDDVLTTFLTPL